MLRTHEVGRRLRERGYQLIHFNTSFVPTSCSDISHVSLGEPTTWLPAGTRMLKIQLVRHSALRFFNGGDRGILAAQHRRAFRELAEVPLLPGPKFTFCHLVTPHAPFVFKRDGQTDWEIDQSSGKSYVDQVIYLNQEMTRAIDAIRAPEHGSADHHCPIGSWSRLQRVQSRFGSARSLGAGASADSQRVSRPRIDAKCALSNDHSGEHLSAAAVAVLWVRLRTAARPEFHDPSSDLAEHLGNLRRSPRRDAGIRTDEPDRGLPDECIRQRISATQVKSSVGRCQCRHLAGRGGFVPSVAHDTVLANPQLTQFAEATIFPTGRLCHGQGRCSRRSGLVSVTTRQRTSA